MDTPDKGKLAGPSLSNFEDSPVFRFIDSLSPINPVKQVHAAPILNSPALPSPSLLFPSPQISSARFCARRHDSPDDSNVYVLQLGNKKNTSQGALEIVHQSKPLDEKLDTPSSYVSAKEVTTEWYGERLDLKTESPKTLRYDNKRPDGNILPWNKVVKDFSVAGAREGRVHHYEGESSNEKRSSFESEINLHSIKNIEQLEEYTESAVLQKVCNIADQLYSSSPRIHDDSEDANENTPELGTSSEMSILLNVKQFNTVYLRNLESSGQSASLGQCDTGELKLEQTPAILSTNLLDKIAVSSKVEMGGMSENQSSEHSALRRCLLFETVGACKRKTSQVSKPNSSASFGIDGIAKTEEHLLPTIGLHLNSLRNASQGGSTDRNMNTDANQLAAAENSPQSTHVDEVDDNKSRKKRSKLEPFEEAVACKRCNCKRSKCLKLYCDCFAAGLYCIEPCSCQDCFNKPIHESIVLETRKLIESRNPLAFAPKVIRSEAIAPDSVRETNKTPASGRHKRGCNCKKSSCLKKYCECFQEGVGCSTNCRCEGCKNTFGQKDETDGAEIEDLKPEERNSSVNACDNLINEECPEISRPSVRLRGSFLRPVGQPLLPAPIPKQNTKDFSSRQLDSGAQPGDGTSEVPKTDALPHSWFKSNSPNSKRVSPPHHETSTSKGSLKGIKLILRSVPPFPSLSPASKE